MQPDMTDFGFTDVPRNDKPGLVRDLFTRVAGRYDLMNDLMSLGLHRCWKRRFIHKLALAKGQNIIDVAAGTGDISLLLHKTFPYLNLTTHLVDLTPSMLEEGRLKAIDQGIVSNIHWTAAPAEELPIADASMDIYTISFGLRNVADREAALKEAYRVLKPGGYFYCLEFSQVEKQMFQKMYDLYSFKLLPFIGKHVAKDEAAYQYLVESIRKFPNRAALEAEITKAGFERVSSEPWVEGIVAFHQGRKRMDG
jgi:demethylmenaquinone methyltransferase/2-methoxy-6-polyprenyl-1,4-benzoquinol methylase